mmetsp:Transcript_15787/g.22457  ORF Transcript_15787/g.22457 Transcript_15787/m.22457 type:complete len:166 (-) Transcript_15787:26-523(-)
MLIHKILTFACLAYSTISYSAHGSQIVDRDLKKKKRKTPLSGRYSYVAAGSIGPHLNPNPERIGMPIAACGKMHFYKDGDCLINGVRNFGGFTFNSLVINTVNCTYTFDNGIGEVGIMNACFGEPNGPDTCAAWSLSYGANGKEVMFMRQDFGVLTGTAKLEKRW